MLFGGRGEKIAKCCSVAQCSSVSLFSVTHALERSWWDKNKAISKRCLLVQRAALINVLEGIEEVKGIVSEMRDDEQHTEELIHCLPGWASKKKSTKTLIGDLFQKGTAGDGSGRETQSRGS